MPWLYTALAAAALIAAAATRDERRRAWFLGLALGLMLALLAMIRRRK
ncbi:hypothetical protein [Streptomyces sp. DASNCL29]|nr:hypothetical protein [Streptomyces sp. DASNCL29]